MVITKNQANNGLWSIWSL